MSERTTARPGDLADSEPHPRRMDNDTAQTFLACSLVLATCFVPQLLGSAYWSHSLLLVNLFVAVAALQNFLLHDGGQTSFGQGAVFGVGAYTAAMASALYGLPYALAAVLGVLAASLAGLLYALPALRVQGYYLGFVTLSAATVFPEMLVAFDGVTQGVNGISLALPGWGETWLLGLSPLSLAVAAVACAALASHALLRRTGFGRAIRVASASPEAARSLGISPGLMRCAAFAIAAVGSGIAGVLYPPLVGFVSPDAFGLDLSILFFFAVIVGGRGQILGTLFGVWILYLLPNVLLAEFSQFRLLAYGAIALLVMLAFPDGVIGSLVRRHRRQRAVTTGADLQAWLRQAWHAAPAARPSAGSETPALEVRGAARRFGSVVALDGVDLQLPLGAIHGLVGANGSGKTTLLNALGGFVRLDAGSILLGGRDISRRPARFRARLGIGRTFQKPRIFLDLSLWENLLIGLDALRDRRVAADLATQLQGGPGALLSRQGAERIPHGQRRLVEVARVILTGADILLLDEPAAGLSPAERERFKALLRSLRDDFGKTIVLVEHDLELVWDLADSISVLDEGRVVAHGSVGEIADAPAVRNLFIGGKHA
ncbi:Vitamin B12 import ATP-binding protein BtuD [compost metagenome]